MDKDFQEILDELVASIRERNIVIFCGAGISINSGIPGAVLIAEHILMHLGMKESDRRLIVDERNKINPIVIPFEMFIEYLEASDKEAIFKLFDIFNSCQLEPNINHIFLAKLAEFGLIKTIVTTNFDTLIEQAFESKNINYRVYYKKKDFQKTYLKDDEIKLIKIHGNYGNGSKQYKNSIISTIKKLSLEELRYERNEVIEFCFAKGKHKHVLVLGYSCSDIFDVTPQIELINRNSMKVTFIEHSKEEIKIVEPLEKKLEKNPFKKFLNSYRVFCSTDFIVNYLWDNIFKDKIPKNKHLKNLGWESAITSWIESINPIAVRGWLFYFLGQFEKSIEDRKAVLNNLTKMHGDDLVSLAVAYNNVGEAFYAKGDYDESIKYHQHALRIRTRVLGRKSPDVATSYNNLGEIHYMKRDYYNAIMYYEQALNIREKVLGKHNSDTATSYNNLGQAYYSLGKYEKAINFFEQSLVIRKIVLGEEHPSTAMSYNNLGATHEAKSEHDKAIDYYKKSLEIKLKVFPKDHPSVAKTYNNLGEYFFKKNDYDIAISYFKMSLEIREKALGKDHVDTKQVLNNMQNAIKKLRNLGKET